MAQIKTEYHGGREKSIIVIDLRRIDTKHLIKLSEEEKKDIETFIKDAEVGFHRFKNTLLTGLGVDNDPSTNEYEKAKQIVSDYEKKQSDLYFARVEEFRKDLQEYFLNNPYYKIEEFTLGDRNIIPSKPCLEEAYDGEMNEDIEALCKKHNVDFSIIYWCYHK